MPVINYADGTLPDWGIVAEIAYRGIEGTHDLHVWHMTADDFLSKIMAGEPFVVHRVAFGLWLIRPEDVRVAFVLSESTPDV